MTKEREHRLISLWGNRCVNCGSTEDVEWQYIVPFIVGGKDVDTNIRPLCKVCGYARIYGIHVSEARKILGK